MKLTTKDTKTSKKLLYTSVYDKLYKMIINGEYTLNSKFPLPLMFFTKPSSCSKASA